jgi:hypothetical protein
MNAEVTTEVDAQGSLSVGETLALHYRTHGLPADGGASASWFRVRIGPLVVPLPNPPARKRAVYFHDVNHVATGYNTVFSDGEMLISAYELGCGCGSYLIAWLINLGLFGVALFVRPRSLFRAFVRGRRAKSVYAWPDPSTLPGTTVRELRARLAVPVDAPLPRFADRALFAAWAVAAVVWNLAPIALIVAVVRLT